MAAKTVSSWRNAKASVLKQDTHIVNVQPTNAIWDCANFVTANGRFTALPWNAVGATAVFKGDQAGKLAGTPPLLLGHTAPVIDLAFHPFDDSLLFTASEDATIRGWRIPSGGLTENITKSVVTLAGHAKKVGILAFHPSACNVLASAGADQAICLWDVTHESPKIHLRDGEVPMSLNWNLDGTLLNTTTKDRKVNVYDSRTGVAVASAEAHPSPKTQRSVWAKRRNQIVTVGFSKQQFRQAMVWDLRHFAKPLYIEEIDQQSSVMMPFMDDDLNILYLAGKGDGTIKYFELWEEATPIVALGAFTTSDPQRGLAMLPKSTLNVRDCEIARFVKLAQKSLIPVVFHLPRKQAAMEFQEDVYPPTFAAEPAIDAHQFFQGRNSAPKTTNLHGLFDGHPCVTSAPKAASPDSKVPEALREEPKPQPKEEPKPQPKEEPKPQPKEEPKPQPKEEPKPQPKEEPKPQPKEEPKPQHVHEEKPEAMSGRTVSGWRNAKASVLKQDTHIVNVQPTNAIWDCANFVTCQRAFHSPAVECSGCNCSI